LGIKVLFKLERIFGIKDVFALRLQLPLTSVSGWGSVRNWTLVPLFLNS